MPKTLAALRGKTYKRSLKPLYDYIELQQKAMSGDLVLEALPATTGSSAAAVNAAIGGVATHFDRTVTVKLKDAAGDVHEWFNGTFAIAVVEVTAGNGTASIVGGLTAVTLVDGVGTVTVRYIGTWASGDTSTLTVTGGTKLGYTVANKTSVDTLIA